MMFVCSKAAEWRTAEPRGLFFRPKKWPNALQSSLQKRIVYQLNFFASNAIFLCQCHPLLSSYVFARYRLQLLNFHSIHYFYEWTAQTSPTDIFNCGVLKCCYKSLLFHRPLDLMNHSNDIFSSAIHLLQFLVDVWYQLVLYTHDEKLLLCNYSFSGICDPIEKLNLTLDRINGFFGTKYIFNTQSSTNSVKNCIAGGRELGS